MTPGLLGNNISTTCGTALAVASLDMARTGRLACLEAVSFYHVDILCVCKLGYGRTGVLRFSCHARVMDLAGVWSAVGPKTNKTKKPTKTRGPAVVRRLFLAEASKSLGAVRFLGFSVLGFRDGWPS